MNKQILNVLFTSLFIFSLFSCVSTVDKKEEKYDPRSFKAYDTLPKNTNHFRFYEYGNGFLIIALPRPTLVRLQGGEYPRGYCDISYKAYGAISESRRETLGNKIKIDGILVDYSVEYLEPIENNEKTIRTTKIMIGESVFSFDFNVETVPISLGASYNEVIEKLGIPDDELKGSVDTWSITETGSGYYHNPNYNERYGSVWSIKYNKYPNHAFSFDNNGVLKSLDEYYYKIID